MGGITFTLLVVCRCEIPSTGGIAGRSQSRDGSSSAYHVYMRSFWKQSEDPDAVASWLERYPNMVPTPPPGWGNWAPLPKKCVSFHSLSDERLWNGYRNLGAWVDVVPMVKSRPRRRIFGRFMRRTGSILRPIREESRIPLPFRGDGRSMQSICPHRFFCCIGKMQ